LGLFDGVGGGRRPRLAHGHDRQAADDEVARALVLQKRERRPAELVELIRRHDQPPPFARRPIEWSHGYVYFWLLSAAITVTLVVVLRRARLL